jgi:hypothetical protein
MSISLSKLSKNFNDFFATGTTQEAYQRLLAWSTTYVIARLFSQGLSNFFALETLRHGTNPLSWLSIHVVGALPFAGGGWWGGDAGYGFDAQNKNRFYCAHEVNLFDSNYEPKKTHLTSNPLIEGGYQVLRYGRENIFRRICRAALNAHSTSYLAKTYAYSSIDNVSGKASAESDIAFLALLTPNIKFHIPYERMRRSDDFDFRQDPSYPVGFAYSTHKWISPIHSGLIGVIWNSLSFKTFERMKENPKKVFTGLAQMGVAAAAAALVYRFALPALQDHRWAARIGTVMAII